MDSKQSPVNQTSASPDVPSFYSGSCPKSPGILRNMCFCYDVSNETFRALTLWHCDNSLTVALEMSKTLLRPMEYLMELWPCPSKFSNGSKFIRKLLTSPLRPTKGLLSIARQDRRCLSCRRSLSPWSHLRWP